MKKTYYFFLLFSVFTFGQENQLNEDKMAITAVLNAQEKAWNNYDIEAFMEGYWKSEELKFYGSAGVIKGWQATLDRYKKSYPTKDHFGTLRFVLNDISMISKVAYYVLGEFHLTRTVGNANGIFMLVLKKIDGNWKIIADTSAAIDQ